MKNDTSNNIELVDNKNFFFQEWIRTLQLKPLLKATHKRRKGKIERQKRKNERRKGDQERKGMKGKEEEK